MKARIVKWGNSLAVRIPKTAAEKACFKEGDSLEIETTEGEIKLRRIRLIPNLNNLIAQITPENRYNEIPTKIEVGRKLSNGSFSQARSLPRLHEWFVSVREYMGLFRPSS